MEHAAAAELIRNTFNNPFAKSRFRIFVGNLLNHLDDSPERQFSSQGSYIPDAFKGHVRQCKRVGTYTTPDDLKVDVLIVYLKKDSALDQARTMQRNFVIDHLKKRDLKDAALVAYVTDGLDDWRFSLVRMEYRTEQTPTGRVKIKEEFTPARRYSFLVGKNEPNHTAQQQLCPILEDTRRDPTLEQLEAAFNIESVTKEFFDRYKDLFLRLKEELDAMAGLDRKVAAEFERCNVDTTAFAKKLMGQIVFLYFLQKKGWLGVKPGQDWGTGARNFLADLFQKKQYQNYFNDILEPLFYEALAVKRPDDLYPRLNCKVPFLNGGLFEPTGGYDWQKTDVLLQNETFAAIFQTFNLYNFTVREDEPLEREVAVDPEMLGKVFENLLEVTDRKSKGAFYTPREIVHYMCQESLISYLDTRLNRRTARILPFEAEQGMFFGSAKPKQQELIYEETAPVVPRPDLETFIRHGELVTQNDSVTHQKEEQNLANTCYEYHMPSAIREHAPELDKALEDIRICDPAIGSGAFPVGLMVEIVKARQALTPYLKKGEGRSAYLFKRHAIENSIYGVDIDASAVDVARLRLWLSLVVDEDDFRSIKPLPNLDYKIVCGNSLLGLPFKSQRVHEIERLKRQYFHETDRDKKAALRQKIDTEIQNVFAASQKSIGYEANFDFRLYFSEVFEEGREGFDVVIGNPPYIQLQSMGERADVLAKMKYETFARTGDIYCLFYEKGFQLLRTRGILAYITSNKWMRAGYGEALRKYFAEHTNPLLLIDFSGQKIFEAATVDVNILISEKLNNQGQTRGCVIPDRNSLKNLGVFVEQYSTVSRFSAGASWSILSNIEQRIKAKIEEVGTPLKDWDITINRGIVTGLNEAFIITGARKDELIAADPKSAEIIRPILRGRDIQRYGYQFADLYLICTFPSMQYDIEKFPAIKDHLLSFGYERLNQSGKTYYVNGVEIHARKKTNNKWFETQDSISYWNDFYKQKIIWGEISDKTKFSIDEDGVYFAEATTFLMTGESLKFLLCFLNSQLSEYFFAQVGTTTGVGTVRWKKFKIETFPIPKLSPGDQIHFVKIVDRILALKKNNQDTHSLEKEIDLMIYKLFNFSTQEIATIEGKARFQ